MATPSDYFDLIDYGSGTGQFASVFLYPNNSTVDTNWVGTNGPITDAIKDGLQQLYDYGSIDWYEVWKLKGSETYPKKDDTDKNSFAGEFSWYLNSEHPEYYQFKGLHYGIGANFDGGGGTSADSLSETAFRTNTWMIMGAGSGNTARAKTFAKQEMLHGYTAYKSLESTNLMDSGGHMHEHDPGLVYVGNEVSPFAITYHNTHAGHAKCDSTGADPGYHPDFTSCTKDAVLKTKNRV